MNCEFIIREDTLERGLSIRCGADGYIWFVGDAVIGDRCVRKGHEDEETKICQFMEVLEPSASSCHSVMPGSSNAEAVSFSYEL